MINHRALLLALPLLLTAMPAIAAPAACPPAGTVVVKSRGGTVEYGGTIPGIPDLCRITRAGVTGNFYMGGWRTDWPGAGDAYPALKEVLNGPPGTKVAFITRSLPNFQFVDDFVNEGFETLTIDGKSYQTVKIAHGRKGFAGNTYHSVITNWRDIATGVTLRTHEEQIAGQSYGPDTTWTAVRVETAPPK